MNIKILLADINNLEEIQEFLNKHADQSLFLLSNLNDCGFRLSDEPNSGDFRAILIDKVIRCVFSLTRRGSLLVTSEIQSPEIFDMILSTCKQESLPLKGVVGEWDFCHAFWEYLHVQKILIKETFVSKENLYSLPLDLKFENVKEVRLLEEKDMNPLLQLRLDSINEAGTPTILSTKKMEAELTRKMERKIIWGLFSENQLVSIADLNAKTEKTGQVGGVYTVLAFRNKGYSQKVMIKLLFDCKNLHNLEKVVLFTGENNIYAQKLYESLHFKKIGHYALLFGDTTL